MNAATPTTTTPLGGRKWKALATIFALFGTIGAAIRFFSEHDVLGRLGAGLLGVQELLGMADIAGVVCERDTRYVVTYEIALRGSNGVRVAHESESFRTGDSFSVLLECNVESHVYLLSDNHPDRFTKLYSATIQKNVGLPARVPAPGYLRFVGAAGISSLVLVCAPEAIPELEALPTGEESAHGEVLSRLEAKANAKSLERTRTGSKTRIALKDAAGSTPLVVHLRLRHVAAEAP